MKNFGEILEVLLKLFVIFIIGYVLFIAPYMLLRIDKTTANKVARELQNRQEIQLFLQNH